MAETAKTPNDPGRLKCTVVTPERIMIDQKADFVALPILDGELGVLPGHMPTVARLGYGELRVKSGQVVQRYFVDGGFAQIRGTVVSILTARAIPVQQIDKAGADAELARAEAQPAGNTLRDRDEKDKALARARALVRLARSAPPAV